jgi:hypothetical protein
MNVIAWVLVIAGICAFVAAVAGLILVWFAASGHFPLSVTQQLDRDYYAISHTKHAVWPFLVLLIFSLGIAVGGYIHTDRFIDRFVTHHVRSDT